MRKKEMEKNRDEVEELIQAAQDELLLKLSVDSHIASSGSASASAASNMSLDSDLERRFEALKSGRSSSLEIAREDQESKAALGDDLFTRFADLKAKTNPKQTPVDPTTEDDDEDEDDQVEKLIQWAKDAARLDPSASSDDDGGGEERNHGGRKRK